MEEATYQSKLKFNLHLNHSSTGFYLDAFFVLTLGEDYHFLKSKSEIRNAACLTPLFNLIFIWMIKEEFSLVFFFFCFLSVGIDVLKILKLICSHIYNVCVFELFCSFL